MLEFLLPMIVICPLVVVPLLLVLYFDAAGEQTKRREYFALKTAMERLEWRKREFWHWFRVCEENGKPRVPYVDPFSFMLGDGPKETEKYEKNLQRYEERGCLREYRAKQEFSCHQEGWRREVEEELRREAEPIERQRGRLSLVQNFFVGCLSLHHDKRGALSGCDKKNKKEEL